MIVGVHSAKFPSEKLTANIRAAVMRHDIHHPVVNDAGFQIWQQYAVRAWPTIVLIDPRGYYVGSQPGEIQAEALRPIIERMIAEFDEQGLLDRRPLDLRRELAQEPPRPLRYPGKVLATDDGRLFVTDTGHHRVLELRLTSDGGTAAIGRVFGSGAAALRDGPARTAAFHGPQGLALDGSTLYVADTDNHAIRAIDLENETVRTVAGTGAKAHGRFMLGPPTTVPLRSPWGVLVEQGVLFIAMAGSHQIWALLGEQQLGPWAGAGFEALVDGSRAKAGFNQPSDLAAGNGYLYVADAEASAVRAISLPVGATDTAPGEPEVTTLVGQGLFDFGDVDGVGDEVRLQHPIGIAARDGVIYIADSYNHKIKQLEPAARRVTTLIGTGQAGSVDGSFATAELFEPEGLAVVGRRLYIADTNNHLLRVADLDLRTVRTLTLHGLERLQHGTTTHGLEVRLDPVEVGAGVVMLALEIELPSGYTLNPEAPITLRELPGGEVHSFAVGERPSITRQADGDRDLLLDLTVYPCETGDERVCLIHDVRLVVPLVRNDGAPATVRIPYHVSIPAV